MLTSRGWQGIIEQFGGVAPLENSELSNGVYQGVKMYAVIRTGGKQYRVSVGDIVKVEKLPAEVGKEVVFERVCLIAGEAEPHIGQPEVPGAVVVAEVAKQGKSKKVISFTYRRRKDSRRMVGHRQDVTTVKIKEIKVQGEIDGT